MPSRLEKFEAIARSVAHIAGPGRAVGPATEAPSLHPFDTRNIHPGLPAKVKTLFDDGHFPEATSLAFKFLDKKVNKISGIAKSGLKLMMDAFDGTPPKVKLNPLSLTGEVDKKKGYLFIFVVVCKGFVILAPMSLIS